MAQRQSKFEGAHLPKMRRMPLTAQDVKQKYQEAEMSWNLWASKNKDARERYEHKFEMLGPISDPKDRAEAIERLCMVEERKVFIEGAQLWSDLFYWADVMAAYGLDKQIIDVNLNDEPHWWRVLMGRDDPIHHEFDPVKGGKVFMPKGPMRLPNSDGEQTKLGSYKIVDRRGNATNSQP